MSDAGLRELEREVAATGSPGARLRLAAALERGGRPWEALEALLPGRDDPAVRGALGRFPALGAWPEERGRWLDAPPLARAPRLRWSRPPEEGWELLALGPLGVVRGSRRHARVEVLDPDTGTPRWSLPWRHAPGDPPGLPRAGHWPELVGGALLAWEPPDLVARDAWTGQELWRLACEEPLPRLVLAREGRLLGWDGEVVWARALPEPARPPGGLLWSRPLEQGVHASHPPGGSLRAGGGRACLRAAHGAWWVLDAATGELQGQLEGEVVHADAAGLLVRDEEGISAWSDPAGPPDWSLRGVWHELATPSAVLLEHHEGDGLWHVAHDRRSGARLGLVEEVDEGSPLCAAGGLVLLERGWDRRGLSARTWSGEPVWDERLPEPLVDLALLAPLAPRRLVGLDRAGTWCCLEGA